MADRLHCPECDGVTIVVLDDVTIWSRVYTKGGRLERGGIARRENPLEALGGHLHENDDLICTNPGCGWMGRSDSVALGDQHVPGGGPDA